MLIIFLFYNVKTAYERRISVWSSDVCSTDLRDSPLDGRTLHLDDALFTDDALVWDPVHSDKVRYGPAEGPAIEMGFPDTPRLGVWTKPGARFVFIRSEERRVGKECVLTCRSR